MQVAEMVDALRALVEVESPSDDPGALKECADRLAAVGAQIVGSPPERVDIEDHPAVLWSWGPKPKVMLVGHFDTVWPIGTTSRWPFSVDDGRATGPGSFDMKAGIVQGLFALASLDSLDGVRFLLTSDEELGTPCSHEAITSIAGECRAVLVLEPSADGALKTARKGVSRFDVEITGRASHAGLDPEKGINATIELAHQVLAIEKMARPEIGTTVTPTVASAGTAVNVVPAQAVVRVDVRASTKAEQDRVEREVTAAAPVLEGAKIHVRGGSTCPPFEESASSSLFALAQRLSGELGLEPLRGVAVGGGSDGNRTAALGVPTLDGLGAVGGGAHAEGEHVFVDKMPERAMLVAALVAEVLRGS